MRAFRMLAHSLGLALTIGVSLTLSACGEDAEEADTVPPPSEQAAAPDAAAPPLPTSGPEALVPLLGRWATRPELCAATSPEAGSVLDITADGFKSGQAGCKFFSTARSGPSYRILSNCSSEASGPVPDEPLLFVFIKPDIFEWRSAEGAVQFRYLRCP